MKATIVLHSRQVISARSAPMPRNSCLGTTPFFVGSRVKREENIFADGYGWRVKTIFVMLDIAKNIDLFWATVPKISRSSNL